jgi:hypothetical protein
LLDVARAAVPTGEDRTAVAAVVLGGLARGAPLDEVLAALRSFVGYEFPFPGDVLTEIAAEALEIAGAKPATPLSLTGASERHLPEWSISGNTAHQKYRAALQAAIALHAGIAVDYDELAGWWRLQDYTRHAFAASVVLIRVAAEQSQRTVRSVCEELAERRNVALTTDGADDSAVP